MWISIRYGCFVLKHKWYVLVFGLKVGGIPLRQLLMHDMSKFSRAEFGPYMRRHWSGGERTPEYDRAWTHHWRNNPHHWEYWMSKGRLVPMPEVYVREMVADWQAANRTYGTVSIDEWFQKAYPKMELHYETLRRLIPIIESQGFTIPVRPHDYAW